MSLTILQVAYPFAPVEPDAVGGAEQVLGLIERNLPRFGHRAIVAACTGSRTDSPLLATPLPAGTITDEVRAATEAAHARIIQTALDRHAVDLVHMHGIDFHRYLPPPGVPVLVTLHLPPGWYPPEVFRQERPQTWLHAVSWSQHWACPCCATLLPPVGNGVPVEALRTTLRRRDYALVLGRICPEKNQHTGLEAGSRAGMPVLLGGQVFPYAEHERYWRDAILPRLAAGPHRFLGPGGFARKRRLLSAARCLVSASLAPETSSPVAMEALSCGTPVGAIDSSALGEIVEDGVMGFLVRDVTDMAAVMQAASGLSAEACRESAARRFSADAMLARYAELYAGLAGTGRSHAA